MQYEEVNKIIRRQHGIVSREQARATGLSARQIDHQCATRRWIRIGPCVYRHAAVAATWRAQLLAACLIANGVASHRSAAALHGIDGFRETVREITVPEGLWKPIDAVRLHRTRQWYTDQHIVRDHIPCTDLSRTIIDVAAVVHPRRVQDMVDAVMRTNRFDLSDLYAIVVRHARRGRNGCGVLREVLEAARALTEPPGLNHSALACTRTVRGTLSPQAHGERSRSGVPPTRSRIDRTPEPPAADVL